MRKAFEYFQPTPLQGHSGTTLSNVAPCDTYVCGLNVVYDSSKYFTRLISFDTPTITVYGWPSRGGVIIPGDGSPADLDFLDLDRRDPPMLRHESREEEDGFCQKLLLLGAKVVGLECTVLAIEQWGGGYS